MNLLDKKKRKIVINVTSLIDVVLLLLIFFMLTSTFTEQPGMKLELPETKGFENQKLKTLEINISSNNEIFINGELADSSELEQKLQNLIPDLEEKSIIIKADRDVSHGKVVRIMDIAKISGIDKIVLATKNDSKS